MENEVKPEITILKADMVYQSEKALIDSAVATARHYPRDVRKALEEAIITVTLSEDIAKSCHYALPRGGKPISGPSVHLAKIMLQCWGNIRAEVKVVSVDLKEITSEAVCFDLQKNSAIKVQVKRSIVGSKGRFDDSMIVVTGNAANSIALRNAIFAVIPEAIVNTVYKAAKNKMAGDVSSEDKLMARRKIVVDGLISNYGVTEKEILDALGKQAIININADSLIQLIGLAQALVDGDTTVDIAFRGSKTQVAQSAPPSTDRMLGVIEACTTEAQLTKLATKITTAEQSQAYDKKLQSFKIK